MVEYYDPETKQPVGPPKRSRAQISRDQWENIMEEIRRETGIPIISYSYHDTRNEFEVRLRGRKPQYYRTEFGEMVLKEKGTYEKLMKSFFFKGEGKSPYPRKEEMEKWQGQIMKWAKSLDGKAEIEGVNYGQVVQGQGQGQQKA